MKGWSYIALMIALATGAAACREVNGLTQLTDEEIRDILPGTTLSYVIRSTDYNVWTFGCDGEWIMTGAYWCRALCNSR